LFLNNMYILIYSYEFSVQISITSTTNMPLRVDVTENYMKE